MKVILKLKNRNASPSWRTSLRKRESLENRLNPRASWSLYCIIVVTREVLEVRPAPRVPQHVYEFIAPFVRQAPVIQRTGTYRFY